MEDRENLNKMLTYMEEGWNKLTYNKFDIIHKELLENEYVCFTDGDIVYQNQNF